MNLHNKFCNEARRLHTDCDRSWDAHCRAFLCQPMTGYIQWYEIASHSGKEVPTVSYFPPLAPLYTAAQALGPGVDARNVAFHDRHHGLVKCNYGITQWCDMLMGTRRMPSRRPAS